MSDIINDELLVEQSDDPETVRELEELRTDENIYNLYWTLIKTCEEYDLPLFNRLDSYYLKNWLKSYDISFK
jgi:hypothetical protein